MHKVGYGNRGRVSGFNLNSGTLPSVNVLGEQNSEGGEGAVPGNHLGAMNYWYLTYSKNS